MKIEHNGWLIEVPDNGDEVWIAQLGRPGRVHIVAAGTSWVANLWPENHSTPHSTLWGQYEDLVDEPADTATPEEGPADEPDALLTALQTLIPHVLHYATMPHAHSAAYQDAAEALAAIHQATGEQA